MELSTLVLIVSVANGVATLLLTGLRLSDRFSRPKNFMRKTYEGK